MSSTVNTTFASPSDSDSTSFQVSFISKSSPTRASNGNIPSVAKESMGSKTNAPTPVCKNKENFEAKKIAEANGTRVTVSQDSVDKTDEDSSAVMEDVTPVSKLTIASSTKVFDSSIYNRPETGDSTPTRAIKSSTDQKLVTRSSTRDDCKAGKTPSVIRNEHSDICSTPAKVEAQVKSKTENAVLPSPSETKETRMSKPLVGREINTRAVASKQKSQFFTLTEPKSIVSGKTTVSMPRTLVNIMPVTKEHMIKASTSIQDFAHRENGVKDISGVQSQPEVHISPDVRPLEPRTLKTQFMQKGPLPSFATLINPPATISPLGLADPNVENNHAMMSTKSTVQHTFPQEEALQMHTVPKEFVTPNPINEVSHMMSKVPPKVPPGKTFASVKREIYQNPVLVQSRTTVDDSNVSLKCENVVDSSIPQPVIMQLDRSHNSESMHTSVPQMPASTVMNIVQVPACNRISSVTPNAVVGKTKVEPVALKSNGMMNTKPVETINTSDISNNEEEDTIEKPDKPKSAEGENAAHNTGSSSGAANVIGEQSCSGPENASMPPLSSANNGNRYKVVPERFVPAMERDSTESNVPHGSTNVIILTREDMGRHIPVWNRKMNYKLAGTSAPLGRNLIAYLEKKQGEYEIYTDQDRRRVTKDRKKSARVTLWNKTELRKISGTSAPLKKNIQKYLKEHPYCEIYNGQADNLDPSLKNRVHNRVTLWNKVTCRRTGFGSAGPLRKNLRSYLLRNPHLEEYIGQDKALEAAQAETEGVEDNQEFDALHSTGAGETIHHPIQERWHPQSPHGKRPCQLSEENQSNEDLNATQESSDHFHPQSSKRHCTIDLSDVPDLNQFPDLPFENLPIPPEWYEYFDGITETTEVESSLNPTEWKEDGLNTPKTQECCLGTPTTDANLMSEPVRHDTYMQGDRLTDLEEDCTLEVQTISPEMESFNPDDFLKFDADTSENTPLN